MQLCKTAHQRVLDLCGTLIIFGLGTELRFNGRLYRDTVSAGYHKRTRHGYNQAVNVSLSFSRVTTWSNYSLLENTLMLLMTSAQMGFWSRCPGHDQASVFTCCKIYLIYLPEHFAWHIFPKGITWAFLPDTCSRRELPENITWYIHFILKIIA